MTTDTTEGDSGASGRTFGQWTLVRPSTLPALLAGADAIDLRFVSGISLLRGHRLSLMIPSSVRGVRLLLLDPYCQARHAHDLLVGPSTPPSWLTINEALDELKNHPLPAADVEVRLYESSATFAVILIGDRGVTRHCEIEPCLHGVSGPQRPSLSLESPADDDLIAFFRTDFENCWAGSRKVLRAR